VKVPFDAVIVALYVPVTLVAELLVVALVKLFVILQI
jgi:hypothetical protein